MTLSVASFKQVASGFKTHKEQYGPTSVDPAMLLSTSDIAELRACYSTLDKELFDQIVVVRKGHRQYVTDMLHDLVQFRDEQGWANIINEQDLNPMVVDAQAHTVKNTDDSLPLVRIQLSKIDPSVASPKDFQHEAQYAVQEASRLHPKGEIGLVLDFAKTSFNVLRQMNTSDLNRGLNVFQLHPVKVKRVYVMNTSFPVRLVIQAVLSLASSTIRKKVVLVNKEASDDSS